MLVALIVACCALVIVVSGFASLLRSLIRQHARERELLTNQLLHLSGRTWTPPPAEQWSAARDDEPLVRVWTATPEQQPLDQ